MTTPERFRRRQRLEGALLVLLGIFVAFSTYLGQQRDNDVRDCLAEKVDALSSASGTRGDLVTEETEATKKVLLSVPKAKSQEELSKILNDYRVTVDHIQAERLKHPVPPYPQGACAK